MAAVQGKISGRHSVRHRRDLLLRSPGWVPPGALRCLRDAGSWNEPPHGRPVWRRLARDFERTVEMEDDYRVLVGENDPPESIESVAAWFAAVYDVLMSCECC